MTGLSRRTLLSVPAAGALGTVTAAAAGCGDEGSEPPVAKQADALNDALELERAAVATYEAAPDFLSGRELELAEIFFSQEREHVDALEEMIEALGATATERRTQEAYLSDLGLTQLEGREDFLRFAVDLENTAIALYGTAAATVTSPETRRTIFTVLAAEAEHLTVVLGELGEPQVPDAFLFGSPTEVRGL